LVRDGPFFELSSSFTLLAGAELFAKIGTRRPGIRSLLARRIGLRVSMKHEKLVHHLAMRASHYFVVRTASSAMLDELAPMLSDVGMRKVHFSALSLVVGPMEIWQRGKVSPYIGAH
jgi:hypothetical protein